MVTIRGATLDDTEAITLLMRDLGYPANPNEIKKRFEQIYSHKDYKTLLTIGEGGEITGMIGMSRNYSYEHNGQYVRILALIVNKAHRNKGIGRRLLYEAEHWAKEINSDKIVLNSGTREERQDAYIFYLKMGYVIKSSGFVKILVREPGQFLTAK